MSKNEISSNSLCSSINQRNINGNLNPLFAVTDLNTNYRFLCWTILQRKTDFSLIITQQCKNMKVTQPRPSIGRTEPPVCAALSSFHYSLSQCGLMVWIIITKMLSVISRHINLTCFCAQCFIITNGKIKRRTLFQVRQCVMNESWFS